MCFIPLTQTYYAPGWRWPYESHKAGLMNMIVKTAAQYGLSLRGRSFGRKPALQKCMLIKMSSVVSQLLKYVCCSLMDFPPSLETIGWVSAPCGTWIKANPFSGRGFVLCCHEVGTICPPLWPWNSIIRAILQLFWGFHCNRKLSVRVGSARWLSVDKWRANPALVSCLFV